MPEPLLNLELLLNLREQAEAKQALVSAMRADPLRFYVPHPKQDSFHRAAASHNRRAVFAGNRFGKSQMGCAEDGAWLRGERIWYSKDDPSRVAGIPRHPVKGLVITTDWDKVDEIWTTERGDKPGKIWRVLPSGFVKNKKRNHSGAIDLIECANGSVLRFDTVKSFMANPQGSESSDWDFIHVDEPCPELMFKASARGLIDRRGAAWFTLTALSEPWISDLFDKGDKGQFWSCYGSTYDNPHLSREAIAEFECTLTDDERECRLHGIPLHKMGVIYKEFSQPKHVLKETPRGWASPLEPPLSFTLYVFIDPHPQTPHAVLFCAVSPLGQRFYYADIFVHCTVEALCMKIRELISGRRVGGVRIDPIAYVYDPVTDRTMADEFARCGIPVEKATKDLVSGILRVQQELARDPQTVWFLPTASRTLWEITRYRWDQNPKRLNRPIDVDDHMMENLYRCELSSPTWIDPENYSSPVEELTISHRPNFDLADISITE
jgi:hypothetical protein